MTYTEEAIRFACSGDMLLGILAKPELPADTGVLVIVGGPQYRVGSHRQFVLLSRTLARSGYAVLRFDYRGMGDSEGQQRDFQAVSADIAVAISALQQHLPSMKKVVLWGLCDAASAALLYLHETGDARVVALCLLNPWVRSDATLARTQVKHYYTRRLMQKEFWIKLLRGGVARTALSGLMRSIRVSLSDPSGSGAAPPDTGLSATPFQHRMAAAWDTFSGSIFLLLSSEDLTAKEFLEFARTDTTWKNAFNHPRLVRHDLLGADHTFSSTLARLEMEDVMLRLGLPELDRMGEHFMPSNCLSDLCAVLDAHRKQEMDVDWTPCIENSPNAKTVQIRNLVHPSCDETQ